MQSLATQEKEVVNKDEEAKKISAVYKLLSRVFIREVDVEFLRQLKTPCFYESLKNAGIDFGDKFISQNEMELLEDLAVEYARLFLTGYNVALYESVYTDPSNRLYGDSTVNIAHFYQKCGLMIVNKTLIPDHIGLELELMSYLKEKESISRQNGNKDTTKWIEWQKEFISQHLGKWAKEFFRQVEAVAEHPFYREMAKLGSQFMQEETKDA